MLATIGTIIVALLLAVFPAGAAAFLAMWWAEKANPHDPIGPGLLALSVGGVAYLASVTALLSWGL